MRIIWVTALVLAALSTPAFAQQLAVRSGDHPTFSRLTIPIPATQVWETRRDDLSVIITLPEFKGGFDLGTVFSRMRRNRIAHIAADGATMTLQTNCPCQVEISRMGELLVIDVADPIPEPAAETSATLSSKIRPPLTRRRGKTSALALPWIGATSPFNDNSQADNIALNLDKTEVMLADRARLLSGVQEDLIAKVADAASSGLLESNISLPHEPTIPGGPSTEQHIDHAEKPLESMSFSKNLLITSSMDPDNRNGNPVLNATTAGLDCPEDSLFSISEWGTGTEFSEQIGRSRNALIDARDRLNVTAAIDLAQLYIYFGFGAEALDVLRLDPGLGPANVQLANIATILEYGAIDRQNALGGFTDCASDIALWASLSHRSILGGILIDTNAALRGLNNLPTHLRLIVAPALSNRLLQYGDPQAAATALRSIERLPVNPAPNAIMAQAEIVIGTGEAADKFLEDVIAANTTESPAALVKFVQGKLAENETLSPQTATLVEAYAQELRGTDMGNQLLQTRVLALSQSGQFAEAFDALEALKPAISPQAENQLRQNILETLTKKSTEVTFLEHVFAQPKTALTPLPDVTKLLLASRLMDLGFAGKVQEILNEIPMTPKTQMRQILAARAAIALRQPFQAQAELIGAEGPDANVLLAKAKEMAGAFGEAAELFKNINSEEQALQAAWLSEEWGDLIGAGPTTLNAVATLPQQASAPSDLGLLGQANSALEESNSARQALEALLADPIVTVTPGY